MVKRAHRLNELADFIEKLPEHKFNISQWCEPDHTCKTSACIAGWAVLNYTEEGKTYLEKMYDAGRRMSEVMNDESYNAYWSAYYKQPQWHVLGMDVLDLTESEAYLIFQPDSRFWGIPDDDGDGDGEFRESRDVTNVEAANLLRWVASHPENAIIGMKYSDIFEPEMV